MMKTRRGFLSTTALLAAPMTKGLPVEPTVAAPRVDAPILRDYWNDLPQHFTRRIQNLRAARLEKLRTIRTRSAADERAAFTRAKVWDLIGGSLERSPLQVKHVGTIERDQFRIEKLIYESQPEFYVPAHLYLPKSGKGPFPTVISPLGHAEEAKLFAAYRTLFENLAKRGFAVFTWDPPGQGERYQYLAADKLHSRFNSTGEHYQFGWPALLIGSSTTQFEAWDAIRAIDYLETRPELDTTRLGCCGHSGGGTMTMYLCALEPRIQAAIVVEGHTENVASGHYEPPGPYADAEQNLIGSLPETLDRGDLLAAFAPKPLLLCYTHMDNGSTYSPHYEQGTQEILAELKTRYGVYGAADRVALSASSMPHDYDFFHRAATYRWFSQWLGVPGATGREDAAEEITDTELRCTASGQILTALGGRTAYQINGDHLAAIEKQRTPKDRAALKAALLSLLHMPPRKDALAGLVLQSGERDDFLIEDFDFHSETGVRTAGYFLKPRRSASIRMPVALLLLSSGKSSLFNQAQILQSAYSRGVALCAIDTRGAGRVTPHLPSSGPLFYGRTTELAYSVVSLTAGFPMIGQRVWDIIRCMDWLSARPDVNASKIGLMGAGPRGLEALFTASVDDRISPLLLDRTPADLSTVVTAEDHNLDLSYFLPGVLKHTDLPEIVRSILPRTVWLTQPVDANGHPREMAELQSLYGGLLRPGAAELGGGFKIDMRTGASCFDEWLALMTV